MVGSSEARGCGQQSSAGARARLREPHRRSRRITDRKGTLPPLRATRRRGQIDDCHRNWHAGHRTRPPEFRLPRARPGRHQQCGEHPAAAAVGVDLYRSLIPSYENVHRGQSTASRAHDRAVRGVVRHHRRLAERTEPAQHRHLPQHHRGAQRRDVLAADRFPRRRQRRHDDDGAQLELRSLVRAVPGDPAAVRPTRRMPDRPVRPPAPGELDLEHLASLVDSRTKLVCCTGASNFLGTKPPLPADPGDRRRAAVIGSRTASAGRCCWSTAPSWCRAAGSTCGDLDVDYLSFSFHKLMAPFGVGVLYAKEHLLAGRRCRSCTAGT